MVALLFALFAALFAPAPAPAIRWPGPATPIDQGATDACTPSAILNWEEAGPNPVAGWRLPSLGALYVQAQAQDHWAFARGATVGAGFRALAASGRALDAGYTTDPAEALRWLQHGPVVFETAWYPSMYRNPAADGVLTVLPVAAPAVYHAYLCLGWDGARWECVQSWGPGWGLRGRFYLRAGDVAGLIAPGHNGRIWHAVKVAPGAQ